MCNKYKNEIYILYIDIYIELRKLSFIHYENSELICETLIEKTTEVYGNNEPLSPHFL